MQCYLARNCQIQLKTLPNFCQRTYKYRYQKVALEISPFEDDAREFSLLQSLLEACKNEVQSQSFWDISFVIAVAWVKAIPELPGDFFQGFFELSSNSSEHGSVLKALHDFWGDAVTVKAEFDVLEENNLKCTLTTTEMLIQRTRPLCKDPKIQFPCQHFRHFDNKASPWSANVTFTVSVPNEFLAIASVRADNAMCQKILYEKILSDVAIGVDDELKIQANKKFLAGRSQIFLVMLQSFLVGSNRRDVNNTDFSVTDVEDFLKDINLFQRSTSMEETDCELLFEFLYAAHYYHVSELEQTIKNIILDKPRDWYDEETAEKMIKFAFYLTPEGNMLKTQAMEALQLYRQNVEELSATLQPALPIRKDTRKCIIL